MNMKLSRRIGAASRLPAPRKPSFTHRCLPKRLFPSWTLLLMLLVLPAAVHAQFNFTTNNGAITLTGYAGPGIAVTIPGLTNGLPVVSIGSNAFAFNTDLTSVTIPGSVTNIGNNAFSFCLSLTAVYFEGNAPSLGSGVFGSPSSPPSPNGTFPNCYYLPGTTDWAPTFGGCPTFMLVPPFICLPANGTITIDGYTGSGGELIIPSTINGLPVSGIGLDAFSGCGLSSVTIPNSVTVIGGNAFNGCVSLTNLSLPSTGLLSIGSWAFIGCTSLTSVTIPNSVTSIGYNAFGQCTALTNLTISRSVTSIGQFAFYECTSLTSVYFMGDVPSADWTVFMSDNQATVYYLPGTQGWGSTFGGRPTALWVLPNPLILNNGPRFGVQTNEFGFIISWATNASVVVEVCTALINPTWVPVATNTLTDGSAYFRDPTWTNYPGRFYRIRSP